MRVKGKLIPIGNSLGIIIPKAWLDKFGWSRYQTLTIIPDEEEETVKVFRTKEDNKPVEKRRLFGRKKP